MRIQILIKQAIAVIVLAGMSATLKPKAATAADQTGDGCTWCRHNCPADIVAYCTGEPNPCPTGAGPGSSCTLVDPPCKGSSGQDLNYKVHCKPA